MSDIQQTVTRKDVTATDDSGQLAQQTVRKVHTESSVNTRSTLINLTWFVYGVIAVLLGLRFVLLALGANSSNGFVSFIYSVSRVFSMPFDTIFNTKTVQTTNTQSVIEPSILVAIVIYTLIAWGIVKLLTIRTPHQVNE
jgi:hypothetical protein